MRALAALKRAASRAGIVLSIVIFDDASSDGTPEAIRIDHADAMLVRGDGTAYWNGGLYLAWKDALNLAVDGYLWLNDDVELYDDSLETLRSGYAEAVARRADGALILVAATEGPDNSISYGGYRLESFPFAFRLRRVRPGSGLTAIDTFNGNCVFVTRAVVDRIGLNDPRFFHNLGDIDYGLRARQSGLDVWLLPRALGRCAPNVIKSAYGYGSPHLTIREQWRIVNTHHGLPPLSWFRFTARHSGAWFPLHFLLPYRHLIIPAFHWK